MLLLELLAKRHPQKFVNKLSKITVVDQPVVEIDWRIRSHAMKTLMQPDVEHRPSLSLWDTLIRVGAIGILVALCFQVFSPFLNLIVWSIILAVTLYPVHQMLARRIGGRQGLSSIILAILGVSVIVVPTWLLMN